MTSATATDQKKPSAMTQQVITVAADTQRVHCPPSNYPLWSQHPRVYMDLSQAEAVECPYCSTRFVKK